MVVLTAQMNLVKQVRGKNWRAPCELGPAEPGTRSPFLIEMWALSHSLRSTLMDLRPEAKELNFPCSFGIVWQVHTSTTSTSIWLISSCCKPVINVLGRRVITHVVEMIGNLSCQLNARLWLFLQQLLSDKINSRKKTQLHRRKNSVKLQASNLMRITCC